MTAQASSLLYSIPNTPASDRLSSVVVVDGMRVVVPVVTNAPQPMTNALVDVGECAPIRHLVSVHEIAPAWSCVA